MPNTKLTPELIEEHNIIFEGPIPPSDWPPQYAEIFRKIRDIGRLQFDEYGHSDRRGMLTLREMSKRVLDLTHKAYTCRNQRENEMAWRIHTEPMIVSGFSAEVVW